MEAQNLWMKGDQTRLNPFYAGCLYKTGVVCLDQGKVEAAVCVNSRPNLVLRVYWYLWCPLSRPTG